MRWVTTMLDAYAWSQTPNSRCHTSGTISGVVARFAGKPHDDAVAIKGPEFFNQPAI